MKISDQRRIVLFAYVVFLLATALAFAASSMITRDKPAIHVTEQR